MKPLLQLHLETTEKKAEAAIPSRQEGEEPKPVVVGKRLKRLANKAAHRAALEYGRSRSSIFSK